MGVIEHLATLILKFTSAPGSHWWAEGRWRWLRLLVVFLLIAIHQTFSPGPWRIELPATSVGRRRHSLRRHKGWLWTILFNFLPPRTVAGWLSCCVAGTLWLSEGVWARVRPPGPSGLMRARERSRQRHALLQGCNLVRLCWSAKGIRMPTPGKERDSPARATNPRTSGRLTQEPAGTNPRTGQATATFFNLVGVFKSCEPLGLQRVGDRCTSSDDELAEVSLSSVSSTSSRSWYCASCRLFLCLSPWWCSWVSGSVGRLSLVSLLEWWLGFRTCRPWIQNESTVTYELSDGNTITVGAKRFLLWRRAFLPGLYVGRDARQRHVAVRVDRWRPANHSR